MRPLTELNKVIASQGRIKRWIALKMGWSYSSLVQSLNGSYIPPDDKIIEMCGILGVDPAPYLRK
jgi:hypothetical protein